MSTPKEQLLSSVEQYLEEIREPLVLHGGNVELVDVDEGTGTVQVRLHGACVGCPMAEVTLKGGIAASLKEKLPWIKTVIAVE